jgi:hypothetical protein
LPTSRGEGKTHVETALEELDRDGQLARGRAGRGHQARKVLLETLREAREEIERDDEERLVGLLGVTRAEGDVLGQ